MTEEWTRTVVAPDGVAVAVFVSGRGRPLVVVHGTTSDHTTWRLMLPLLQPHMTVHLVDRRGRGASGDRPDYSLDLECADVAAVVDAAAAASGGPVDLFGHSYGGNIAFGAANLTGNIRKLVLYEGWPPPNIAHRSTSPALMDELESLLAQGRNEQVLEAFYRHLVLMSDEEINGLRSTATWTARVAAAHTIPRELRAFGAQAFDPALAEKIAVPVLLIVGADSPEEIKADPAVIAKALPRSTMSVLKGQRHMAHLTDPDSLAEVLIAFLCD